MLNGLELTFIGLAWSNLVFLALQVLLSHLWEKEKGGKKKKKKKGRREKVNRKGKEGRKKE